MLRLECLWTIQASVGRQSREQLRTLVSRHKVILNTEMVVKIMGVDRIFSTYDHKYNCFDCIDNISYFQYEGHSWGFLHG